MEQPIQPADGDAFVVRRVDSGPEVLLEFIGELDVAGIARVSAAVQYLPAHGDVIIDLSQLEFMDSSGIGVLMSLDLRSRAEEWKLTLQSPQPQVLNVLTLCGFEGRFEITP